MKPPSSKMLLYLCILFSGFGLSLVLYLLTFHLDGFPSALGGIFHAMQPILIGLIMAYLMYPLARNCEQRFRKRRVKPKAARVLSVGIATIVLLTCLVLLSYFIFPQLASNVSTLVSNLPSMIRSFTVRAEAFLNAHGQSPELLSGFLENTTLTINRWLQTDLLSTLASMASGLFSVAKILFNLAIGIIVMIYLLMSRDQFIGQGKKILYAFCKNRKTCSSLLYTLRHINKIFSGFITGKLIDSLIIGVICGVCLTILNIPYALLISIIVGCTNIIPIFGPIIGAIPSAFLLLLADPKKCLIFIIFIIILQQVDGNIIGPMILGDSTGLPAFWVLFSLLLFNQLMGFIGMIVGVPLFATLYYLARRWIQHLLNKRDLPTSTADYIDVDTIDESGMISYLTRKKSDSPPTG